MYRITNKPKVAKLGWLAKYGTFTVPVHSKILSEIIIKYHRSSMNTYFFLLFTKSLTKSGLGCQPSGSAVRVRVRVRARDRIWFKVRVRVHCHICCCHVCCHRIELVQLILTHPIIQLSVLHFLCIYDCLQISTRTISSIVNL